MPVMFASLGFASLGFASLGFASLGFAGLGFASLGWVLPRVVTAPLLAGGVAVALVSAWTLSSSAQTVKRPEAASSKIAAASAPAAPAPTAAPPAALPNGATALTETYGDWLVVCATQGTARRCGARQEQVNQEKRMVLAIELVPADDRLEGVALLPFGLALDSGVKLQIDDTPAGPPRSFRTCVPAGCLLPLSLDAHTAAMLRSGTTLKAKVVIDGGADTVLAVSLKGLSSALDRTAALLSSATDRDVAQK